MPGSGTGGVRTEIETILTYLPPPAADSKAPVIAQGRAAYERYLKAVGMSLHNGSKVAVEGLAKLDDQEIARGFRADVFSLAARRRISGMVPLCVMLIGCRCWKYWSNIRSVAPAPGHDLG